MTTWFKLKSVPPNNWRSKSISKNGKEFLLASSTPICSNQDRRTDFKQMFIHKYNVRTNEWCTQFTYPSHWSIRDHSIAINTEKNEIYLVMYKLSKLSNSINKSLTIINMNNHQYQTFDNHHGFDKCFPLDPSLCITTVHDTIHSFVCIYNDNLNKIMHKHLIFDQENNTFKENFEFMTFDYNDVSDLVHCSKHTAIHVPSKNILLLFISHTVKQKCIIWTLNLKTNEWTTNNTIKYKLTVSSAALISNQQFVILYDRKQTKIYLLDIRYDDYTTSQCIIQTPFEHASIMERTEGGIKDEMLIFGWIKQLFQQSQFQEMVLPPVYIIKLLMKWYSAELIHFICGGTTHFCIAVKHLLLSAKTNKK